MRLNPRARLDPSQISDRRGRGGGGIAVGGGLGGLVLLLAVVLLGGDPSQLLGGGAVPVTTGGGGSLEQCRSGAQLETDPECRYVFYVNSIQEYWEAEFARAGSAYQPADTTVFSGSVQTGCGAASAASGPFYCPADQGVYLDLGFFGELQTRFGGRGGDFAEAYVLAHEYGHHVQNLTGRMRDIGREQGPDSPAVRLELQADCYAGLWAAHATGTSGPDGQPLILDITDEDIAEGIDAARIVGDDYIQERFGGTVTPETWTHGSSEQRQRWFRIGLDRAVPGACDTFSARSL